MRSTLTDSEQPRCCRESLFAVVLVVVIGCQPSTPDSSAGLKPSVPAPLGPSVIEVTGRTQCIPARRGIIAPVPLHPVIAVLVAPGDRVKKGQPLVKIDDDEAQADVRAKQAALQTAHIALKESRRHLATAWQCRCRPKPALPGTKTLGPANASLPMPKSARSYSPAPERPDDVHTPSPASWVAAEPPCRGIDRSAEQFLKTWRRFSKAGELLAGALSTVGFQRSARLPSI
jgi:hypothetical protein